MNKKLLIGVVVIIAILVAIVAVMSVKTKRLWVPGQSPQESTVARPDPRNATYTLAGEDAAMKNGEVYVQLEPGVMVKYTYFQHSDGWLNEDIIDDSGVVLVGDAGASGTFYYVAALVSTESGWRGTNATLLGDRIAPQTIDVSDDMIIVNYADRKPGEAFTVQPSVGVTRYFQVRNGVLVEVDKDKKLIK